MLAIKTKMCVAAVAAVLLAGCGSSPGDRAASGALIGAAAGNPGLGAAVGAGAGALVGATTDPCDLNLGDPFWRDNDGRRGYERRCGRPYRGR